MVRILLTTISLFILSVSTKAQNTFRDSIALCSNRMDMISYFWKKDSLANNGYRLIAVEDLLNCKLDSVSKEYLLKNLGKPSRIEKYNGDVEEYVYYTYDYRAIPKEKVRSRIIYFIGFFFDKDSRLVGKVEKGHYD